MPERNGDVGFAGAGISHEQDVLAQVEIFAAHELGDEGPVDGRVGGEVKHVEGLEDGKLVLQQGIMSDCRQDISSPSVPRDA